MLESRGDMLGIFGSVNDFVVPKVGPNHESGASIP